MKFFAAVLPIILVAVQANLGLADTVPTSDTLPTCGVSYYYIDMELSVLTEAATVHRDIDSKVNMLDRQHHMYLH